MNLPPCAVPDCIQWAKVVPVWSQIVASGVQHERYLELVAPLEDLLLPVQIFQWIPLLSSFAQVMWGPFL